MQHHYERIPDMMDGRESVSVRDMAKFDMPLLHRIELIAQLITEDEMRAIGAAFVTHALMKHKGWAFPLITKALKVVEAVQNDDMTVGQIGPECAIVQNEGDRLEKQGTGLSCYEAALHHAMARCLFPVCELADVARFAQTGSCEAGVQEESDEENRWQLRHLVHYLEEQA